MGSCFSDHIGKKLERSKFNTLNNPLGITFNPMSLVHQLDYVLTPGKLKAEQLEYHDGLWHHFDFHGCFSGNQKREVFGKLLEKLHTTNTFISRANYLFLTFGTAIVYKRNATQKVVANNHKFPIGQFTKKQLEIAEILSAMSAVLDKLYQLNPGIQIIFTVSPVRYVREGLIENQRSKANLILAVEKLCKKPTQHYFPSYELFIDVLRDYRFYASDLIHPNMLGIDFVWEKFRQSFFDEHTLQVEAEIDRLVKSTEHRPIHPESETHKAFLEKLKHQINDFASQYSQLDFSVELNNIDQQLDQSL
jgi:hypothetical protein